MEVTSLLGSAFASAFHTARSTAVPVGDAKAPRLLIQDTSGEMVDQVGPHSGLIETFSAASA